MEIQSKDIVFIVNPNSGVKDHRVLVDELKKVDPEIRVFKSLNLEVFHQFFQEEVNQYKVVIIGGGDGSVNTTIPYLLQKDLILAVMPNGSGNGFAREMGFGTDFKQTINWIKKGKVKEVDVMKFGSHYSTNVAGIGFDAYVAHVFDQLKVRGLMSYVKTGLKSYHQFKPVEVKVEHDQGISEGEYLLVDIANIRQYGNNALISPQSNPQDGRFELVFVKKMPWIRLPFFLWRLMNGKLKSSQYIHYVQTKQAVIHSNASHLHVDGEAFESKASIDVSLAGKMKVIATNL